MAYKRRESAQSEGYVYGAYQELYAQMHSTASKQGIDYRRYNEVKVFISQPMNGKDEQTILEERAEMISRIKERYPDAEILESYFEDYKPSTGNVALKYLSKSLELLADADEAWFAPGWQNARGCRIENDCAIAYGITVHEI